MSKSETLNEEVYRRIKRMIILRQLEPGTKLVLRNLASQFGTSTMPVLESIRRLERDGLVTQIPKWGAHVKEWTDQEMLEALHIRRALEGEAARLFVMRATDEQKRRLLQLNHEFDSVTINDPPSALEIDVSLHLHIARSTGFSRLTQLIEVSKVPMAIYLKFLQENSDETHLTNVGAHRALVEALLGNDPESATRRMWEHIETTTLLNRQTVEWGHNTDISLFR